MLTIRMSIALPNSLPNPWEKYLPSFKANMPIKNPTQVQNDFERIIQVIGTPASPPKPRKKAPDRKLGDIQVKRLCHAIIKKKSDKLIDEKMVV